ncbi:MAG: flagellar type III secretion system protein FlhB [Proteobacteria bacterium]|nr:MAG: flagellar type III secretion system protein FlhB [Pseudomonadota bacterium]
MADEDNSQEKTEQPTPKRLKEARDKGQIARSRELNTMAMMLVSAAALLLLGPNLVGQLGELMSDGLRIERAQAFDLAAMLEVPAEMVGRALELLMPLFLFLVVVAILAPLALGGWAFSPQSIAPKLERISPLKGIKRVFSSRGLMEMIKALAKFALVASVAVGLLWNLADDFLGLGQEPLRQGMAHMGSLLGWSFLLLSATTILIAAIDVPFQLWYHHKQLRMTRQEIKDEMKETEGRPEVKGKIRNLQREIAQRRMMAEVPKADVVITNPTHFAVALRYDQDRMRAPRVVAKGRDLIAQQIRTIALDSGVYILSAPPLARALYHTTEIDQEVPSELYLAVAQVLAYVYQLRIVRREGGKAPDQPTDLPVPDQYH